MTDHTLWHPEAFLQNRYTRSYRRLIETALAEDRTRVTGAHHEHHIVPESFFKASKRCADGWLDGDPDAPENLVLLTHNEHAWCHILLARRMTWGLGRSKMATAIRRMTEGQRVVGRRITSVVLGKIMATASEANSAVMKEWWENLTQEEKAEYCRTIGEASSRVWANLTPEEKAARCASTAAAQRLALANITPEEKAVWAATAGTGVRRSWAGLTPEERAVRVAASAAGLRLALANMTPEEKARLSANRGDRTVYHWTHKDGTTFTGTRKEHRQAFNWPHPEWLKNLFGSAQQKTCRGWSVRVADAITTTEASEAA